MGYTEKTWVILPAVDLNFSIPKMGKRATDHENREWKHQRPWKGSLSTSIKPTLLLLTSHQCISSGWFNCVPFGKCPNAPQEKVGEAGETCYRPERNISVTASFLFLFQSFVYKWLEQHWKKVYNIPGISPTWWSWLSNMHTPPDSPITTRCGRNLAAADQFNIMGIVRGCWVPVGAVFG